MIVKYYDGCTSSSLEVDKHNTDELTEGALVKVAQKLLTIADRREIMQFIIDVTEYHGIEESSGPCSQCGDMSYTYTLII